MIWQSGVGLTVTSMEQVLWHPLASVTVTVYTPLAVTEIDWVFWPVDHDQLTASPASSVRVTVVPWQAVVPGLAVIWQSGVGLTVTSMDQVL